MTARLSAALQGNINQCHAGRFTSGGMSQRAAGHDNYGGFP